MRRDCGARFPKTNANPSATHSFGRVSVNGVDGGVGLGAEIGLSSCRLSKAGTGTRAAGRLASRLGQSSQGPPDRTAAHEICMLARVLDQELGSVCNGWCAGGAHLPDRLDREFLSLPIRVGQPLNQGGKCPVWVGRSDPADGAERLASNIVLVAAARGQSCPAVLPAVAAVASSSPALMSDAFLLRRSEFSFKLSRRQDHDKISACAIPWPIRIRPPSESTAAVIVFVCLI